MGHDYEAMQLHIKALTDGQNKLIVEQSKLVRQLIEAQDRIKELEAMMEVEPGYLNGVGVH